MFYRRLDDKNYTPTDLTNIYADYPIFIIAGNPIIKTMPLERLESSRLPTLALNNVLYTYPNPTMWLTADKPDCYGAHFFSRPDIIKFAYMNYRDDLVGGKGRPLSSHPMMLFYTIDQSLKAENFFDELDPFVWWRSVFPTALQAAWRLGARRVYLVGCSFLTNQQTPYAWNAKLTDEQTRWSQATYNDDMRRLRHLKPKFQEHGFQLISCTENSRANEILPYLQLSNAIERELELMPQPTATSELKHSSEFKLPKA